MIFVMLVVIKRVFQNMISPTCRALGSRDCGGCCTEHGEIGGKTQRCYHIRICFAERPCEHSHVLENVTRKVMLPRRHVLRV
jgi:hypothetical protein